MKTEMQQLKENADHEKDKQTLSEIAAYMYTLIKEMREGYALHIRSASYEFAALFFFILTLFTGQEILNTFCWVLFLFVMFRNWVYIWPRVHKASNEFDGCINTLEILGMIDRDLGDKRKRRMQRYRQSYIEKVWEALKQKKRQEAFA